MGNRLSAKYIEECVKHHQAAQPNDFYTQVLTKLLDTMRENERLWSLIAKTVEQLNEYCDTEAYKEMREALSSKDSVNATQNPSQE